MFTNMDLQAGFHQLKLSKDSREKTAFTPTSGLYHFKVLPFGCVSAPANFQRTTDVILAGLSCKVCLCYLDDILVHGRSFKEHNERLDRVLSALLAAGLTLNPRKCVFGARSITFLGHVVDVNGVSPNPKKIEAVLQFPRPDTITKLRSFIGMASFFRKFVLGFADIARPLNDLLKKEADVVRDWTEVHDQAMDQLKEKLASAPVLTHDDGVSQLELHIDASCKGLGAVLYLVKESVRKPIAFASRRLDGPEGKYHINELEFLALLWALKRFQHHVCGRNVLVKTDSSVLGDGESRSN